MANQKNNYRTTDNSRYLNYYTDGSAVPSVEPLEYPEIEYPIENPKPSPHRKRLNHQKALYEKQKIKKRISYYMNFLFTLMIITVGCLAMMVMNSSILEKDLKLKGLDADLKKIRETNFNLETQISEQVDLRVIEKQAVEKLGMSKPESYQIVYIKVPQNSYTVQNSVASFSEKTTDKTVIENIKSIISDIFNG